VRINERFLHFSARARSGKYKLIHV
jgi:hypothetical protein